MTDTSLKSPAASRAAQQPHSRPNPARGGLSTSLTLAAMSLGYGVVQLDVTIVNTALGSIGSSLGGGVSELQWVVSAYTIAFGLGRLRAVAQCHDPDRGARGAGIWRGHSGAELAGIAQPRLS